MVTQTFGSREPRRSLDGGVMTFGRAISDVASAAGSDQVGRVVAVYLAWCDVVDFSGKSGAPVELHLAPVAVAGEDDGTDTFPLR